MELEVNYEKLVKHFEVVDMHRYKIETVNISKEHYRQVKSLTTRFHIDDITNEMCYILQQYRTIKHYTKNYPTRFKEDVAFVNDVEKAIALYEQLGSDDFEISELRIKVRNNTTSEVITETLKASSTLMFFKSDLKAGHELTIEYLRRMLDSFAPRITTGEFVNDNKKLASNTFGFLKENTELSNKNIYEVISEIYVISGIQDFFRNQSEITDLIKKWVSRA
ncbi:hypothetical protein I0P70_06840 [Pontibacter sp. FD36]|uniref:hypothetical protein n=1 Tax=Pontibacter sp. FD36 TaxID=2789860 RepID=UPI0018AB0CA3|nr:hypothetical protein [Pontibacter sp. FD36]MBF8962955.1 hypothetical protein [Pontibacter sp. FD36]